MLPARRLIVAIAAAGALAAAVPAVAQPVGPVSVDAQASAVADSPRVEGAQERIATAQADVDAVSSQLAELRARMARATPDELDALRGEESRLEAEKDLRVADLERASEDAARIAADERRDAVEAPGDDEASDSTTGVVLAPETVAAAQVPAPVGPSVAGAPAAPGYVPVIATTGGADAASIDAYLASKASPMTGLGAVFVAEANRVGLDPRMLVAVSGAETSFGTYGPSQVIHNPFGLGPGMQFADWPGAIRYAASNLAGPLYFGAGHVTIPAINNVWAPIGASNDPGGLNSNWSRNVGMYYAQQGGDPNASVFVNTPTPAATATPVFAPAQGLATPTVTNTGPDAAAQALDLLGTPHTDQDPQGGLSDLTLVRTVYAAQGVTLPVRPNALGLAGEPVSPTELRAGDVILFGVEGSNDVVHMGIYVGGGQFVHAPGSGDVVRLASLYDPVWATAYSGARRI